MRATLEVMAGRREDFPARAGAGAGDAARRRRGARRAGRGRARRCRRPDEDADGRTGHEALPPAPELSGHLPGSLRGRSARGRRWRRCSRARSRWCRSIAWLSLGAQVQVLIGSRGLLPVADFIEPARAQPGVSLARPARRCSGGSTSDARAVGRHRCWGGAVAVRAARVRAPALLRAVDAALPVVRHGRARLPVVPVGQPADRVRPARRVPAAPIAARAGRPPRCSGCCCSSCTSSPGIAKWSRRCTTGTTAAR